MFGFEQIDKILSVLVKDEISVFEDLCHSRLNKDSNCAKCLEICPKQAIQIDRHVILDSEKCNICGLCASACPSGVFEINRPTDKDLFKQLKLLLSEGSVPDDQKAILFLCNKVHPIKSADNISVLSINCLGRLYESLLVGAVYLGAKKVVLNISACRDCENNGLDEILRNVGKATAVLKKLNINSDIVIESDIGNDKNEKPDSAITSDDNNQNNNDEREFKLSRRNFLDHIRKRSVEKSSEVIVQSVPLEEESEKKKWRPQRLPTKRLHLIQIIKSMKPDISEDSSSSGNDLVEGLPFKKVTISEACQVCEFCSKFCPTEAIVKKDTNDGIKLYFNSAYCTGCEVCVETCPDKAVTVENESKLNLNYILTKSATIKKCKICGFKFSSESEDDLCRFCRKKADLRGMPVF